MCWLLSALLLVFALSSPANAATCSAATSPGAAPASWQSYCWLDFSSYNDTQARSAAGQNFSFTLTDGSTLTLNARATSSAATALRAATAPSWSGAAVGNSSFLGIPGSPVLYTINGASTVTLTISAITIIPPPGVAAVTNYAFVVADGESTDNAEYLEYVTNGSPWAILDTVAPISGTRYPLATGTGTATFRSAGNAQPSPIGAHIVASNKPTTVSVTLKAGGLQGIMLAVRFASIRLTKIITGVRIDPADQFNFSIRSTSSGAALAAGTSTGTSNGPFTAAVISTASGIPLTLTESMAAGSVSALSQYRGSLTCTNATGGSATVMPNNVVTSSYNFGSLDFGDVVSCIYTNAAHPHVGVVKQLSSGGRIFATDQFTVRIRSGGTTTASATTTGTGAIVTGGNTGLTQLVSGTAYTIDEIAAGTTNLARYSPSLSCTNGYVGSPTVLPTAINSNFTPTAGDVISCTLTNVRDIARAIVSMTKSSTILSDPFNGTTNPKAIPGAIVRYDINIENSGDLPIDANSISITDVLPTQISYNSATALTFTNGPTPSGLSAFNAATMSSFSNQPGGGGPYSYSPVGAFDSAVTGVRITPQGTMAASNGAANPSFTISFRAQVK